MRCDGSGPRGGIAGRLAKNWLTPAREPLNPLVMIRAVLFWGVFSILLCGIAHAEPRPNIVLFIGDDHGWQHAGFMGHPQALTPNLDALAESGTVFTNVHNTASSCKASLRTFLSGLDSMQWTRRKQFVESTEGDIPFRRESAWFRTLPRELARRGYVSFEGGKFWEGTYLDGGFTSGMATTVDSNFFSSTGDEFGREGIDPFRDFLDDAGEQPFFAWLAPMLPHTPFNAPDVYREPFQDLGLSNTAIQYLANLFWMDDVLGEVLSELEGRGLRQNTLVIYASDNGWELDSTLALLGGQTRGKTSIYEQGFRTPLIFSQPDTIPADVLRDDLVSMMDLFPTLLDVADLPQIPGRWGKTFLPNILEGTPTGTDLLSGSSYARLTTGAPATLHHFVRGLDWRYVRKSDGTEEIYAINEDPYEQNNLIGTMQDLLPVARAAVQELTQRLQTPAALLDVSGRLVSPEGEPLSGVALQLKGRDDQGRRWKLRTLTGASGYFKFANLPHGDYLVKVRRGTTGAFFYRGTSTRSVPVRLPLGAHGVFLPLEASRRRPTEAPSHIGLGGQVLDQQDNPVPGTILSVRLGTGRWMDTATDAEGRFHFDNLEGGDLRIRVKVSRDFRGGVVYSEAKEGRQDPLIVRIRSKS